MKLGKLPPIIDSRTLRLSTYLKPGLPPAPVSVDYAQAVPSWPVMGNNTVGDCTIAAAGHMIEEWTANTGTERTLPDSTILAAYDHFAHGNPDAGASMLAVLKYWRSSGIGGDKIQAFAQLEPQNAGEARDSVYLFGSCYIGLALPNCVVAAGSDFLANPWVVPAQGPVGDGAPNPANGHCVPAMAYDARNLWVVTWGALKSMSWQFYATYSDEAFAVLSPDWIRAKQHTAPPGFDLMALERDLAAVTGTS